MKGMLNFSSVVRRSSDEGLFQALPSDRFRGVLNLYYNGTKIIMDEDDVDEDPYFDIDD